MLCICFDFCLLKDLIVLVLGTSSCWCLLKSNYGLFSCLSFVSYKQFISVHSLNELQSDEERAATTVSATTAPDAVPDTEVVPAEGATSEEGNFGEPTSAVKVEATVKPDQSSEWSEESELAKFNFVRDEMYKSAKEQDSRIVEYESAIRRPYFHVKPLDEAQLANWHRYLDFIEKEGDLAKVKDWFIVCSLCIIEPTLF